MFAAKFTTSRCRDSTAQAAVRHRSTVQAVKPDRDSGRHAMRIEWTATGKTARTADEFKKLVEQGGVAQGIGIGSIAPDLWTKAEMIDPEEFWEKGKGQLRCVDDPAKIQKLGLLKNQVIRQTILLGTNPDRGTIVLTVSVNYDGVLEKRTQRTK